MKSTVYLVMDATGVRFLRKTRPKLAAGQVAVRLVIEVDDAYFHHTIPTVELSVPTGQLIEPEISIALQDEPIERREST